MTADLAARRAPITFGLLLATVMSILDSTVVNVALPHMQGSLSASPEQITWVITSYIVAAAVMTPVSGWLAARLGLKPMLLATIGGFTVASMLCGIATSLPQMVAFRLLQGMAGAPIAPLCQAVLLNINPPERYGRAMALFMMGTVVPPVVGLIIGAWFTESLSWRWCFYINLPAGLASMLLLWSFLPRERTASRPFDFLGFGALAVAIGGFQLLLDRGPTLDWFGSREICVYAVLAAAGLWVFVTHALTARHPLFDRGLIHDRNLLASTIFGFFFNMLLITGITLLPLLMQGVMGYPVMLSGVVTVPRGVAMMAALVLVGRLDNAVDRRLLVGVGLAFCIAGFWMMSRFDLSMSTHEVVVASLLQGIGQGMIFVPLATLAFATLPPRLRADGTALSSLVRNLGGSIGVAVMQAFNAYNGQAMHASLAAHVVAGDPVLRAYIPQALSPESVAGALALDAEITRQAVMVSYVDDFRAMVALGLLCAPLLALLRRPVANSTRPNPRRER